MQVVVQEWVDSSILKIINCFEGIGFDVFKDVYLVVWDQGCKGCIIYCLNVVIGLVLLVDIMFVFVDVMFVFVDFSELLYCFVVLEGQIYKLKFFGSEYVIYIIINDIIDVGQCCLFEVFINLKNMEYYVWIVVLMWMILVVFWCGGDVFFVVEELKVVFDLCGGVWMGGCYVLLIFVVIGGVIECYMIVMGFIVGEGMGLKFDLKVVMLVDLSCGFVCFNCG